MKYSEYLLTEVADKIISIRRTRQAYPIIWFGEKTPPRAYGLGRLYVVEFEDGSKRTFVERLVVIRDGKTKVEYPIDAIVIGGTPPTLAHIKGLVWILKSVIEREDADTSGYIIPRGVGIKSYALVGDVIGNAEMEEVSSVETELYDPPYVYWISIRDGKANVNLLLKKPDP